MPIKYYDASQTFLLETARSSYQMKIGPGGLLLHTYYGPRAVRPLPHTGQNPPESEVLPPDLFTDFVRLDRGFSPNPYDAGRDRTLSCDTLPLEYPCEGSGDYRPTALGIRGSLGVCGCDLRFRCYQIQEGKYTIPGLPAVYADDPADACTLVITLQDDAAGVQADLYYGLLASRDVITRSARIRNLGTEPIRLTGAASCCLDMLTGDWDLIHFHGRHCHEREFARTPVEERELTVGSRRGNSSHQQNPFVILADRHCDEDHGYCLGTALLYSGSFSACACREQFGLTRLLMGVQPERFDYPLAPGETFYTPEAAMAFSQDGLSHLSHLFHDLINSHIVRGPWKNRRRPILINNWEATGIEFRGSQILAIAEQAAELGVEMMVLDDGWFGRRSSDSAGLGDWYVNEEKLGCSIGQLADRIRDMGLRFGLWIEPEMVNEDSDLYRRHPDWVLRIPGKDPVRSRYQLVLDFSRPEIVDHVFRQIAEVIRECKANYVKMDMNRCLNDVWTAAEGLQSQGKILYQYTLGVYHFMDQLLTAFPDLLLEGCAGGGGRFDAGMLYYCPQIWCSDNTDAVDRLSIQYGTSFCYPVSTIGAHVSAVPNVTTGRTVPLRTRAAAAMAGTFGYELDLNELNDEEKKDVRGQITFFKEHWELLTLGLYYRLTSPDGASELAAWMEVERTGKEALVTAVSLSSHGNGPVRYVRLKGLEPNRLYRISIVNIPEPQFLFCRSGASLMYQGLLLPEDSAQHRDDRKIRGQYDCLQFLLQS